MILFPVDPGDMAINRSWSRNKHGGQRRSDRYTDAKSKIAQAMMIGMHNENLDTFNEDIFLKVWIGWGGGRGDIDGPLKCLLDGLKAGGLYKDDHQVVGLEVVKFHHATQPFVAIEVGAIDAVMLPAWIQCRFAPVQ